MPEVLSMRDRNVLQGKFVTEGSLTCILLAQSMFGCHKPTHQQLWDAYLSDLGHKILKDRFEKIFPNVPTVLIVVVVAEVPRLTSETTQENSRPEGGKNVWGATEGPRTVSASPAPEKTHAT